MPQSYAFNALSKSSAPAIALCQNQRFHSRRAAMAGLIQQCTICGNCKEKDQTWFLIAESSREDKLNIWKWNEPMAGSATVHSPCSPRHVRELIVHWMTTGCLSLSICRCLPCPAELQAEICLKPGSTRGPYNGGLSTGRDPGCSGSHCPHALRG